MEAYDPRAAMVSLARGARRRGRKFVIWPGIPTPFVWEGVGCAPLTTQACAA